MSLSFTLLLAPTCPGMPQKLIVELKYGHLIYVPWEKIGAIFISEGVCLLRSELISMLCPIVYAFLRLLLFISAYSLSKNVISVL